MIIGTVCVNQVSAPVPGTLRVSCAMAADTPLGVGGGFVQVDVPLATPTPEINGLILAAAKDWIMVNVGYTPVATDTVRLLTPVEDRQG